MIQTIVEYASVFLALLIVLPVHEFAHAFVAHKCGDLTPKINGRLTLNPMAHFDAYGLVALILVRFGWGKPVPVNPNNFRNRKMGCILVSLAGVIANFLLAFLVYPLLIALFFYVDIPNLGYFDDVLLNTIYYIPFLSLAFFAFNILPIYPLDGFKLYETLSGGRGSIYRFLRTYGSYILLGLILLGLIADRTGMWYLDVLGRYVSWMSGVLGYPITAFWGLIF